MARKYQIFVSSTYDDLKIERSDVFVAILGMGHIPVGMEYIGSRSKELIPVIQEFIGKCDFQITIVGKRYGSNIPGEDRSFTEMEYDYANDAGVPQIAFLFRLNRKYINDEDQSPTDLKRLKAFRTKVTRSKPVDFFETPYELVAEVQQALPNLIEDNDRPGWVRGDQADDWIKRQLDRTKNELVGVKAALGRYRTNAVENNRKRFETNQLPIPNVKGVWQCQEKATTLELFEYGGTVMSFCQTGTHDHWVFGLWSPEKKEIQTQVWRRERAPTIEGEKRLTVMFGRYFNIQQDSFESENFASDSKADLEHNFSEHLTFKRVTNSDA